MIPAIVHQSACNIGGVGLSPIMKVKAVLSQLEVTHEPLVLKSSFAIICDVTFQLLKASGLKTNPREIATNIVNNLKPSDLVEKVSFC